MGGGVIGGVAGGSVGSVAGPVGTVAGGVAGSVAGSNAGAWLADKLGLAGGKPTIPGTLGVNGRQGSGPIEPGLQAKLNEIGKLYPGAIITSLNDADIFPAHAKTHHGKGRAIDFKIPGYQKSMSEDIVASLKGLGFSYVRDEYLNPSENATGGHIHAQLARGGITRGPSLAGEAGPEAVIPLPDGRTIPVKMDVGELVDKLEEMISVMREQQSTSEKILWAQS